MRFTARLAAGGGKWPQVGDGINQGWGSAGLKLGNIGVGRHYDPEKHMTIEQMKNRSMHANDVYLDGVENVPWYNRKYMRILPPALSMRARWFRTGYFNFRFFNFCLLGFIFTWGFFYFVTTCTPKWMFQMDLGRSNAARCAREEAAIYNSPHYVPALLEGYQKLMPPARLSGPNSWAEYDPSNDWKPITK
jgi:hypothetical protein